MQEAPVSKKDFFAHIDTENPVIEAGDISIYATAKDFISSDKKFALIADDREIKEKYQHHPRVLVMDYKRVVLNYL
jgi:hypothetical protein